MQVDNFKLNKFQIMAIIILFIGIISSVILVQRQQNLKSKAATNELDAFEVTDPSGNPLQYRDTAGVNIQSSGQRIYQTNDTDVVIKIRDLNSLVGY